MEVLRKSLPVESPMVVLTFGSWLTVQEVLVFQLLGILYSVLSCLSRRYLSWETISFHELTLLFSRCRGVFHARCRLLSLVMSAELQFCSLAG